MKFVFTSSQVIQKFEHLKHPTTWLSFSIFNRPKKRMHTPHKLFSGFRGDKTITIRLSQAVSRQKSILSPSLSNTCQCCHHRLTVIWRSFSKAVGDNQSFSTKSMTALLGSNSGTAWTGWKASSNTK